MKKILAIAPYSYLPYFSGGQKFIAQFFHHLGQKSDLTVISVPDNDYSLAKTYKTTPLLKKSFSRYYDFSLVKKITALVKENQFDAVIWEHPYYAWLAYQVRKRTGVKTIIHTHNIEYQRFRSTGRWWWPLLKWYEKNCFKKADGLFFITPEDKDFAISNWNIPESKCFELPFGVDLKKYPADRQVCRKEIGAKHQIAENEKILLFTGLLRYKPNTDAIHHLLNSINPVLQTIEFRYKIIICGKDLPDSIKDLLTGPLGKNIIHAGFVDNIDSYYKATDVFLNPLLSGGGVKTKVVEAIANGTTVISTQTGAIGLDRTACGNKLILVKDGNWDEFAKKTAVAASENESITPETYYQKYNWGNIVKSIIADAI